MGQVRFGVISKEQATEKSFLRKDIDQHGNARLVSSEERRDKESVLCL
jgi:hypothetical protein